MILEWVAEVMWIERLEVVSLFFSVRFACQELVIDWKRFIATRFSLRTTGETHFEWLFKALNLHSINFSRALNKLLIFLKSIQNQFKMGHSWRPTKSLNSIFSQRPLHLFVSQTRVERSHFNYRFLITSSTVAWKPFIFFPIKKILNSNWFNSWIKILFCLKSLIHTTELLKNCKPLNKLQGF